MCGRFASPEGKAIASYWHHGPHNNKTGGGSSQQSCANPRSAILEIQLSRGGCDSGVVVASTRKPSKTRGSIRRLGAVVAPAIRRADRPDKSASRYRDPEEEAHEKHGLFHEEQLAYGLIVVRRFGVRPDRGGRPRAPAFPEDPTPGRAQEQQARRLERPAGAPGLSG